MIPPPLVSFKSLQIQYTPAFNGAAADKAPHHRTPIAPAVTTGPQMA